MSALIRRVTSATAIALAAAVFPLAAASPAYADKDDCLEILGEEPGEGEDEEDPDDDVFAEACEKGANKDVSGCVLALVTEVPLQRAIEACYAAYPKDDEAATP